MIGANHLATGAVIGLTVSNPLVALPLAFASHLVLDTFPHFGFKDSGFTYALKQKISRVVIAIEIVAYPLIFLMLAGFGLWVYLAAIVAFSPDFVWPIRYWFFERKQLPVPKYLNGSFIRFHLRIQWCERPWGLAVDIIWLSLMITILVNIT